MTARLVTLYDFYAFDPSLVIDIEAFTDIIGRNFRQPEEGLGWTTAHQPHVVDDHRTDALPLDTPPTLPSPWRRGIPVS